MDQREPLVSPTLSADAFQRAALISAHIASSSSARSTTTGRGVTADDMPIPTAAATNAAVGGRSLRGYEPELHDPFDGPRVKNGTDRVVVDDDDEDDDVEAQTAYVQTRTPMRGEPPLLPLHAPSTPMTPEGTPRAAPWSAGHARLLLKKRSTKELFEEERCSLPTLESAERRQHLLQGPGGGRAPPPPPPQLPPSLLLTQASSSSCYLGPGGSGYDDDDSDQHPDGYYDSYFTTDTPPTRRRMLQLPETSDDLDDKHHRLRAITEPEPHHHHHHHHNLQHQFSRGAVLTEVGDSFIGLPIQAKVRSRDGTLVDQDAYHRQSAFKARSSALVPPAIIGATVEAAPHVTIEETQRYTFAIILRHTEEVFRRLRRRFPSKSAASIRRDLDQQVSQLQQKAIRRLIQAGLGVMILENDIYDGSDRDEGQAARNICLLIDPKKDRSLLVHEFKREMDELAIQQGEATGRMAEEAMESIRDMCFSPALELQLTHNIIQNAFKDYEKEEWVVDVNRELTVNDVVRDCFPLHDRLFNKNFFAEYRKRTFEFRLRKAATGNSDRWAVEELRLHFGERVAFLFAFMHIYTKHLLPITGLCVLYYLCFRFLSGPVWGEYLKGLSFIGFGVACIWGPSFLVCWERETRILVEKWNLAKYKNTVYEKNDYNPSFKYDWVKNELTKEMEKVPKQRRNHWIQVTMLFFVLVSAVVQCLCLLPFIQWYVYAKNVPQCSACRAQTTDPYECTWFITCFESEHSGVGTDRWFYILIQGIALGLLIDIIFFEIFNWVSEMFVKWENFAKMSDFENRLIHRRFVFVWSNWFFWFLFIAFVYLPFGGNIKKILENVGLGLLAKYTWDPATLTLDTLFVTPLVVTQFLNMVLETLVPYLLRKLRGRPVTCRKSSPIAWCASKLKRRFDEVEEEPQGSRESRNKYLTAKKLALFVKQRTGFHVPVMACTDDCNQYTAYEVIAESKLPIFDPMLDYLDACIQFSYVIMFTVVWPLLPFPAFFNNLLEVRGDAFRLLFGQRRPMPRRDTSIGEWVTVLSYANIIGVTVVMGFIVVYQWGYFVTGCNFSFGKGQMVPFGTIDVADVSDPSKCRNESGGFRWMMIQIILFVFLEHIGFCVRYLVLQVEKTPAALRSSGYQRLKQIQRLTHIRSARSSQFEYIQKLRSVFDKFDMENDGHLREPELIAFLAEWICKHPTELLPYSSIIFRYMDKNRLGKVPFSTCCLMLQHVNHDRFFSCILGLYDPINGELNEDIRNAQDGMELRRALSEVSSVVSHRNSVSSAVSMNEANRQRDSSFFYVN